AVSNRRMPTRLSDNFRHSGRPISTLSMCLIISALSLAAQTSKASARDQLPAAASGATGSASFGQISFGANLSFIRFFNATNASITFSVDFYGDPSGRSYAAHYTIVVPAHAAPQKSIFDIRSAVISSSGIDIAPTSGDAALTLRIHSDQAGDGVGIQHV